MSNSIQLSRLRASFSSIFGLVCLWPSLACINLPDIGDSNEESGESGSMSNLSDTAENDEAYVIRGSSLRSVSRLSSFSSSTVAHLRVQPEPGECPFPPDSLPCTDEACKVDFQSEACHSVIQSYCSEHGNESACQGPGDMDSGDEGPGEPEKVFSPNSLSLKVYSVKFSSDAENCSDPILVGEAESPEYVDFFSSPNLINAAKPPSGSYSCVIITMSDHIKWTLDGDSECAGEHVQDVYSPNDQGPDGVESVIEVYFSTAGSQNDDHKSGSGAFSAPGLLLESPHIADDKVLYSTFVCDAVDKVELRYESWSDSWVCDMQPPVFRFETTYKD